MPGEGSGAFVAPGEIPAAEGSPLAGLRANRDRARQRLHLDLRVPRLDPPIGVRYAPLPKTVIDKANKAIAEGKAEDREVVEKSVVLAHVCLGVFAIGDDGKPVGDPSTWPKFDQELASILGLPESSGAVAVVRDLYLTDGDIVAAVAELGEWSAQAERLADEDLAGN